MALPAEIPALMHFIPFSPAHFSVLKRKLYAPFNENMCHVNFWLVKMTNFNFPGLKHANLIFSYPSICNV